MSPPPFFLRSRRHDERGADRLRQDIFRLRQVVGALPVVLLAAHESQKGREDQRLDPARRTLQGELYFF